MAVTGNVSKGGSPEGAANALVLVARPRAIAEIHGKHAVQVLLKADSRIFGDPFRVRTQGSEKIFNFLPYFLFALVVGIPRHVCPLAGHPGVLSVAAGGIAEHRSIQRKDESVKNLGSRGGLFDEVI